MLAAPLRADETTRTSGASETRTAWPAFVDAFLEANFAANPTFAVSAGRHEYDGRLPDYSPTALQAEIDRLRAVRREAQRYPEDSLDAAQRFERDYLVGLLKLTDGNVADAARLADRNRTEFYRLLQKHGLTPGQFRADPPVAA